MNFSKKSKLIVAVVVSATLLTFIVGSFVNTQKMMGKEFKTRFDEFISIFLDITLVAKNERNVEKCVVIINTNEAQEKIVKLKEILQYMNDNAKTEYEIDARNRLPHFIKSLEGFLSYKEPLLENKLSINEKGKTMANFVILRGFRRNLINKDDYLIKSWK